MTAFKVGMTMPIPDGYTAEQMAEAMGLRWEPVGWVGGRPVYPIMGGAVDGPDDEPENDDDEDSDDGQRDGEDASGSADDEDDDDPVRLKAERDRLRDALARSNAQAKKRRLEAKKAQSAAAGSQADDGEKLEKARIEAREPLVRKLLGSATKAALREAGFQGDISDRFLKLVDREAVEVDDDGEIDGLDEQVAQIKRDFPEKFKRKRTGPGDTGKADKEDTGGKALSASARQAAALARK